MNLPWRSIKAGCSLHCSGRGASYARLNNDRGLGNVHLTDAKQERSVVEMTNEWIKTSKQDLSEVVEMMVRTKPKFFWSSMLNWLRAEEERMLNSSFFFS